MANEVKDVVTQLLYDNLAFLPGRDGPINMLPFSHDSETVRTVKRQVCEALVDLIDVHGHLNRDEPQDVSSETRLITISCTACHQELLSLPVVEGKGTVIAALFISTIAKLNPDCPHAPITIEDQRRKMERAFIEQLPKDDHD